MGLSAEEADDPNLIPTLHIPGILCGKQADALQVAVYRVPCHGEPAADIPYVQGPADAEMAVVMAGLRRVIGAIQESRPLPSSPELDALLDQALEPGTSENIQEWARKLGEDVGDLTD
jgi:hypothetical protein